MSRLRVKIANPVSGGARWTSTKRAEYYVRRGEAFMRAGVLIFYGPDSEFYNRLDAAEFERAVREGRGERVYWNGKKGHNAMKRPGQVVC